jgi:hypothetical protein
LPDAVYELLLRILDGMQQGKAISIVPVMQDLTTQQAAALLGVSRPFFVNCSNPARCLSTLPARTVVSISMISWHTRSTATTSGARLWIKWHAEPKSLGFTIRYSAQRMSSDFQVLLDACVLANAALRDTLLRLAEPPCSLFLLRWSKDIIEETQRTLEAKLGLTPPQTAHLFSQLEIHFSDAWVEGYDAFIPAMANHPKDRHVLAAAVVCGAQAIVTFNLKDSPVDALAPWNVEAQSPDEFLIHQYHLDPVMVVAALREQAAKHGGWECLMQIHAKAVPEFVSLLRQ